MKRINLTPGEWNIELVKQFERIGLLGEVFTEKEIYEWLQTPNKHIVGNQTPIQLFLNGQAEAVGDLVDAIITGSPI